MNITILNSAIAKGIANKSSVVLKNIINKIIDVIKSNVPQTWMANIILLIVACFVIFIGSKLTQKFSKLILYILGIILIIGIILNFING